MAFSSIAFLGAFFLVVIPIVVFVSFIVFLLYKLVGGQDGSKGGMNRDEEARLIQEIHQGLAKMEKRIDTLETIVIDREGKKES